MLWILLALFSATHICMAQDDCQCVAYFFCTKPCSSTPSTTTTISPILWKVDENTANCPCNSVYEICCDIGGKLPAVTPTVTETPPMTVATTDNRKPMPQNDEDCGKRKTIVDWKVISDEDAQFGEFPWMVAILKTTSGSQEFLCGGSVIDPFVILTTAHNLKRLGANQLLVKAGVWNTTDPNEVVKHQDRTVARVLLHPDFSESRVTNDFALLFLTERLILNDENVAPVCRPSRGLSIDKSNCVATGWGAESFGNPNLQSVLKKVDLPIIDFTTCQDALRQTRLGSTFNLDSSFLCAGRKNVDTCKGDGGGPLMCPTIDDDKRYVQVGITSWGIGCNNNVPGVYSDVQKASSWIEAEIDNYRRSLR